MSMQEGIEASKAEPEIRRLHGIKIAELQAEWLHQVEELKKQLFALIPEQHHGLVPNMVQQVAHITATAKRIEVEKHGVEASWNRQKLHPIPEGS